MNINLTWKTLATLFSSLALATLVSISGLVLYTYHKDIAYIEERFDHVEDTFVHITKLLEGQSEHTKELIEIQNRLDRSIAELSIIAGNHADNIHRNEVDIKEIELRLNDPR